MRERYHLLDALRGFAIYHVIIFHFLYDVYVVYGLQPDWPYQTWVQLWQRNGCGLFVLVSGMVFVLGRNTFKRGLQLQVLGLLITLVTVFVAPNEAIYYGILTFFGSAMWLSLALKKLLVRVPAEAGMFVCIVGYMFTKDIASGGARVLGYELFSFPAWLYQDSLAILGFHGENFYSADYVPLLPHIFLFWFGTYLFSWLKVHGLTHILFGGDYKIFTWPGTHSLEIYILHQPILMGVCYVIFGYTP